MSLKHEPGASRAPACLLSAGPSTKSCVLAAGSWQTPPAPFLQPPGNTARIVPPAGKTTSPDSYGGREPQSKTQPAPLGPSSWHSGREDRPEEWGSKQEVPFQQGGGEKARKARMATALNQAAATRENLNPFLHASCIKITRGQPRKIACPVVIGALCNAQQSFRKAVCSLLRLNNQPNNL